MRSIRWQARANLGFYPLSLRFWTAVLWWRLLTAARVSPRRRSVGFSTRCSRRNRMAWEWDYRSAALSSRLTTDNCGLLGIRQEARYSNLSCPLLQSKTEY